MTPQTEQILKLSLYDKDNAPFSPFGEFIAGQLAVFTANDDDAVLEASIAHMLGDIGTVLGDLLARAPDADRASQWFVSVVLRVVSAGGIEGVAAPAEGANPLH